MALKEFCAYGQQNYRLHVPGVQKFWDPQAPRILKAYTGL